MYIAKISAIFLIFLITSFCQAQSFWKIKTESGEEILLRIDINSTSKTFVASTRKDAIKDIAGFFAYNLAHAAGKLKYPEIVYIEGQANQMKDSLKLNGTFYYTDKKYEFKATLSGDNFSGKFTDNKNRQHRLIGTKQANGKPIRNYADVLNRIVSISEKYLVNPEWLKSSEWRSFKESLGELKNKISDDYELGALIMWYSRKFPFPFFDVNKLNPERTKKNHYKLQIDELRPHVALLSASQFPETIGQMDSLSEIISRKSINKLVIDLRGRSAISLVQSKLLLNYISARNFSDGAFVSRRFYNLPPSFQIQTIKSNGIKPFQEMGDFKKFTDEDGVKLDVIPAKYKFSGELYILTDSKTNRIPEVLAYILQREKLAKVLGQKTAGQPYLTEWIKISDDFELQLPVGVFISLDGLDIVKLGVTPNVLVEKENALNYLLKTL